MYGISRYPVGMAIPRRPRQSKTVRSTVTSTPEAPTGTGNANDAGEGVLTITVTVGTDPRYTINGVTFSGDIESQLSAPTPAAGATSVVITDSDAATGSGYYAVTVNDTSAVCTLVCDPRITNTPTVPPT